jgi:hypothetical protein
MGIFNFKDFIIEKLGVSESSLVFGDFLESRVYHTFLEFLNSNEKTLDKTDEVKYTLLKNFIKDTSLYADFPVVKFELLLQFKKMSTKAFEKAFGKTAKFPVAVGGSASGFGNKNWGGYSKIINPIKKVSAVGIVVQLGIEVYIDKDLFNQNNDLHVKRLRDQIGSVVYHELNHSYEHFKRTTRPAKKGEYRKPLQDRSFNTSLTYADNNLWKFPTSIWETWSRDFLYYIYVSESHELNANVQQFYHNVKKYPKADIKNNEIYVDAISMINFKTDVFYNKLLQKISEYYKFENIEDSEMVANRLKDMWVSIYSKQLESQKSTPIISIRTLKKMTCLDFVEYWGDKFNKNGRYLLGKISKIKNEFGDNEKI